MRKYTFLAVGAALLMASAQAAANGDGEYTAPETPPEPDAGTPYEATEPPAYTPDRYDWSGLYAGVQGGWLWGEDRTFEIRTSDGSVNDGPLFYDTDGYTVGGVLGFGLQWGHWVYGVEFDIEYADFSGRWSWGNGNGLNKTIDIMGSLRPRVGFAWDRVLFYGTGGMVVGRVQMEAFDGPPPLVTISDEETLFSYTVGGGIEFGIDENWSVGADYRYTDLGETELNGEIFGDNFTYPHTNDFHAVRARVLYRFTI